MARRLLLAVALALLVVAGLADRGGHQVSGEPRATLGPGELTAQVPTLTAIAATEAPTLTAIALLTPTVTPTCAPGPQCVYLTNLEGRALPTPTLLPECDASYPTVCIPPPPPDLSCDDVLPLKNFAVVPPDPHRFDRDRDGIGCEG